MPGGKRVTGRQTAAAEGDIVVFLIGMRINRLRAVRHWLPVVRAMARMQREQAAEPDIGVLGTNNVLGPGPRQVMVIQYWRSFEDLHRYAGAARRAHRPAWQAFNARARSSGGAVGIWHETYLVQAGEYETVYVDVPPTFLGRAAGLMPVDRRGEGARQRLARGNP